jgi:hypothetical protein
MENDSLNREMGGIDWDVLYRLIQQEKDALKSNNRYHRVGRVLSFFSTVVGIGTPPTPHPQASVPPPPGSGERDTLDEGTYTVVLNVYCMYFAYRYSQSQGI